MPRLLTDVDYLDFPTSEPHQRLAYGSHPLQFGDLTLPDGPPPRPVVIMIHGGCYREKYDLRPLSALAADLAEAGFAAWNIEYRRHGNGGDWPRMFQDVATAADHLRQIAERLCAGHGHGSSASGIPPAGTWHCGWRVGDASQPTARLYRADPLPIAAVLALAPVADLAAAVESGMCAEALPVVMGGGPTDAPANYLAGSPSEMLPLEIPQAILIGSEDHSILDNARPYVDAARQAGDTVDFTVLPGVGHFEIVSLEAAWRSARRALEKFA